MPSARFRRSDAAAGIKRSERTYQHREAGLQLRPDGEVVVEEQGLTVQHEPCIALPFELLDHVVEHGNQPGLKRGAGEIPLPVPVGVGDEVKGQ